MSKNNRTIDRIQAIWNMIGGDDVVDNLLAGRLEMDIKVRQLFTEMTTVSFEVGNHKPRSFFQEREGLSMSPEFMALVEMVGADEEIEITATSAEVGYTDALREVKESEVMAQWSEEYGFKDLLSFLCTLANLISAQSNGEEGPLKTNRLNIFFVQVNGERERIWAQYQSRYKKWRIITLDTFEGFEGMRFFSAAFD